jgi:hypothetical protein
VSLTLDGALWGSTLVTAAPFTIFFDIAEFLALLASHIQQVNGFCCKSAMTNMF